MGNFKDWFWSGASLMQNNGDNSTRVMSAATLPSPEASRVIAGAPLMLDTLEDFAAWKPEAGVSIEDLTNWVHERANAAIAKII